MFLLPVSLHSVLSGDMMNTYQEKGVHPTEVEMGPVARHGIAAIALLGSISPVF